MIKRLTILAVLALTVCICTTVAFAAENKAAKPVKAAKAPKGQPVAPVTPVAPAFAPAAPVVAPAAAPAGSVSATLTDTSLTLSGINLVPGTRYAYTFQVWAVGNPYAYWRGGLGGTAVKADGTYSVSVDIADLNEWVGTAGVDKVVMWFRPATSSVTDIGVNADGDPLLVEQRFSS